MSYSSKTITKAIVGTAISTLGAATTAAVAAHGGDISALTIGEWMTALGAGFTAGGGVFLAPNRSTVAQAIKAIQDVLSDKKAADEAAVQSTKDLQDVSDAVIAALPQIPSKAEKQSYDINVNSVEDAWQAAKSMNAKSLTEQVLAINAGR